MNELCIYVSIIRLLYLSKYEVRVETYQKLKLLKNVIRQRTINIHFNIDINFAIQLTTKDENGKRISV